jgi:hypothetical protein
MLAKLRDHFQLKTTYHVMMISKIEKKKTKIKEIISSKMNIMKKAMRRVSAIVVTGLDEFKMYRRIMFAIKKSIKYTLWAGFTLFWYHMYLLKKTEKPENGLLANEFFLDMAKQADWQFYDLKMLLTRPPVEKLLPDRPPLPPGAAYPKTLIVNLRGTLIHSEYKVIPFHHHCFSSVLVLKS